MVKNTAIGAIALILWSSTLPFARQCASDLGPITTVTIQFGFSGLLGLLWVTLNLSLLADFIPWISLLISSLYLGVSIGIVTGVSALLIVLGALCARLALR